MGKGIKDKYDRMAARQSYGNVWHTSLMDTILDDFPYCLFTSFCLLLDDSPVCASYMLRKRALRDDMSRYQCCAGYMPCSGKCGERQCPEVCLCAEVSCCFSNSVASTRFLLQDEFNIQTTKCDNCIIGFMLCLEQFACIFRLIAIITGSDELEDASEILNCLSDTVYCTVCACMQTQHKIEMDKRDGKFGPPSIMVAPPVQHMSRIDQPLPPTFGYPLQPQPWQPPYGHACPPSPPNHPGYPATAAHPPPPPGYPATAAHPPPPPGYPFATTAHPPPPPGYFATACPQPSGGYHFPAGCPPPQNFPPTMPHPYPEAHPK